MKFIVKQNVPMQNKRRKTILWLFFGRKRRKKTLDNYYDLLVDIWFILFFRLAWEALKKSINGLINKVNSPNIAIIVRELFAENIVRGRGLLCQSIMQAQTASPTFTHVYAGLVAIINTKFPAIGELLLKRLIINFRRGFKRNDKIR